MKAVLLNESYNRVGDRQVDTFVAQESKFVRDVQPRDLHLHVIVQAIEDELLGNARVEFGYRRADAAHRHTAPGRASLNNALPNAKTPDFLRACASARPETSRALSSERCRSFAAASARDQALLILLACRSLQWTCFHKRQRHLFDGHRLAASIKDTSLSAASFG